MGKASVFFSLCFPLAVAGCANSDPVGGSGGEGGGPWSTHGSETTTSGKGATGATGGGTTGGGPATTSTGTGSPQPGCGDGQCDANEDCASCAADCGACAGPMCGDGQCNGGETCQTCPGDCGSCATCGDSVCAPTETCMSCYQDCGVCACMADAFEPNNGSPSATPVASGTDYCDLSICAGDVDWIAFTVSHGLDAKITFVNGQGDLDLEIYSAQTLGYVSGSYTGNDGEEVVLSGLAAGTYWARVYGYQGATNPSYCFRVTTN
jgi:hypothetical protein